jgi:arginyl-tRNA synthetase
MAARPRWATPCATCSPRRAGRSPRVLLQRRRRADRHAGQQHAAARQGLQARRRRLARKAAYNGDYIADIANDFLAGRPSRPTTASSPPAATSDDYDGIRQFAVAYLRHEQDKDLQAFGLKFDNYYLESSLYTSGRVEATVNKLVANGKTYEQDGALWLRGPPTTATTRTA